MNFNNMSSGSPFLLRKPYFAGEYGISSSSKANFLCGEKCRNKREREQIENEARAKQLAQEAETRAVQLEAEKAFIAQQQQLDAFQKQMADLQLIREKGIVDNTSPVATVAQMATEEETPKSNLIWYGVAAILIGLGAWWYFKK